MCGFIKLWKWWLIWMAVFNTPGWDLSNKIPNAFSSIVIFFLGTKMMLHIKKSKLSWFASKKHIWINQYCNHLFKFYWFCNFIIFRCAMIITNDIFVCQLLLSNVILSFMIVICWSLSNVYVLFLKCLSPCHK